MSGTLTSSPSKVNSLLAAQLMSNRTVLLSRICRVKKARLRQKTKKLYQTGKADFETTIKE